MSRHEIERRAYGVAYTEQAAFKDTYGGVEGVVFLECYQLVPKDISSDTVLIFSHPVGGGGYLPMVTELARRGNHVIYANSRYRGNDSALIMEKVVLDLAAAIRHARERLGYQRIVLGGWSGGGPLSLFYQQQAVKPSVRCTPAGDPPDLTRTGADPRRGDPAAGRAPEPPPRPVRLHRPLDPRRVRPRPARPRAGPVRSGQPQPAALLGGLPRALPRRPARTRAPHHRHRQGPAGPLRAAGRPHDERAFVVHGTLADPRVLDPAIDPNEREPGVSFLGDPRVVNDGPIGLARFCSLRSWLSQWSVDDANADGVRAAADVTVPALVVSNGADNICTPGYATARVPGARRRGQVRAEDRRCQPLLHRPRPAGAPWAIRRRRVRNG